MTVLESELQAYVDGRLDDERLKAIEAYLDAHPADRSRLEALRRDCLDLRQALLSADQEPLPKRLQLRGLLTRRSERRRLWTSVAAACVFFIVGAGGGWLIHTPDVKWATGIRPLAEEAVDTYRTFGDDRLHPVEVDATDTPALFAYLSARLDRRIQAPDSVDGYRLLGGRAVPTSRGPAAMFMYNRDGARMILMICPLSAHRREDLKPWTFAGIRSVSWSENGVGYSVVGAQSNALVDDFARETRRQIAGGV